MTTQTTETYAEIGIPINPFPGLRPFDFDESHLFFGREGQSESLIEKLSRTHFLAVVGTSGSGKSSLVRAGLLPALLGGFMTSAGSDWRIAIMRPGNDPIGNLARALNVPGVFGSEIEENAALQTALAEATLRRGSRGLVDAVRQAVVPENENLLVVVDQFEEIFRFARVAEGEEYGNEAAGFVKLFLEASRQRDIPICVVLTMRSDYLGDCSQFWDLPEAINESQYLIPRLTRDQLREAITGPVAVGGGQITSRLVNRLLNDVGDDQDQLPVLQHLLMRVWDESKEKHLAVEVKAGDQTITKPHREVHRGEALDLCCYEAVGGMAEALSRHADEAFNELPDDGHREVSEKVFKALTEKGPDNREIRRPITLGAICVITGATAAEVVTVIEAFHHPAKSFLMPPAGVELNSESLIDISHESLIRGWGRLRQWVDEEARSARTYQRLADTAALYRKGEEGFLRDPGLQLALDWQEQNRPNQAWARRYHSEFDPAMDFLQESKKKQDEELAERERQQQAEIERAKRELEQARALAEAQQRRAEAETQKALEQQQRLAEKAKAAEKLRRLIVALLVAGLLALAAMTVAAFVIRTANVRREEASEAQQRAEAALDSARKASKDAEQSKLFAKAKTAEANKLAESAKEQKQRAEELQRKADSAKRDAEAQHRIASEQQLIADKKEKLNRELLYAANMKLAEQAFGENDYSRMKEVLDVYSPTSVRAGSGDLRGFEWFLYRHAYHEEPVKLGEHSGPVTAVAFSPDGKTLASAGEKTVNLWDTGRRGEPVPLAVEPSLFHAVAFAPDGTLATLGHGSLRLWDARTRVGKKPFELSGSSEYESLALSPNGELLAVASGEIVRLWDMTKRELKPLQIPGDSVAISQNGTLAVRHGDSLRLWDTKTWVEMPELKVAFAVRNAMAFSPDGKSFAAASGTGNVKLWDTSTWKETELSGLGGYVLSVAFSPDSKTLATGSGDKIARLWDMDTKKELPTKMRHENYVFSVAFSPDGKTLATGCADHTVKVWDISWREDQVPLTDYGWANLNTVMFSPDGTLLASSASDNTVDLWDTHTRHRVTTIKGHTKRVRSVAFSPDGHLLATGGEDGMVKLWDVRDTGSVGNPTFTISNKDAVQFVTFSRDGRTLAVIVQYERLKLWDVLAKTPLPELKGACEYVNSVAFSLDSQNRAMLAAACNDGVKLWDLRTGRESTMPNESASAEHLAFSRDGGILAIVDGENIKLWSLHQPQEPVVLKGHSGSITSIAFSPDGKRLVSGGYDSAVKVWDVQSGQEVATFKKDWGGDLSIVTSVAFSSNGKMLAIGSMSGVLRLWYAAIDRDVAAQRNEKALRR